MRNSTARTAVEISMKLDRWVCALAMAEGELLPPPGVCPVSSLYRQPWASGVGGRKVGAGYHHGVGVLPYTVHTAELWVARRVQPLARTA